ncbi:hypothetical protein DC007_14760, partial [Enterococcus faecalis]
ALALQLYRPIIFISTLQRHRQKQVFYFNKEADKPPLVFGIYLRKGHEIFLPFFHNKNIEFKLEDLKGKIQIVAYMSKTVPETFKSRPIVDLEAFAILVSLHNFHR